MQPFLLFLTAATVLGQLRFCEVSGACRKCADRRYSYYRCVGQIDCFGGEICEAGFCCPMAKSILALQSENASVAGKDAFPVPAPFLAHSYDADGTCPDGSEWEQLCSIDNDCTDQHYCIDGKCCPSCLKRRRLILDRLATGDLVGKAIPQCADDGKHYRERQCLAGTSECWCVSQHGKRLDTTSCQLRRSETIQEKTARLQKILQEPTSCSEKREGVCPKNVLNASIPCHCDEDCYGSKKCCPSAHGDVCASADISPAMILTCGPNEAFSACYSPCQQSCDDLHMPQCPPPSCQSGCHCLLGFVRRDGSPRSACVPRASCASFDVTTTCSDPLRQYQSCGSACPISCDSRSLPRCQDRCVSGCFCRIPYILENSEDPLHSRCILPADCSNVARMPPQDHSAIMLPDNYPLPTISPTAATVAPHSSRCADPLKNYLSCGTKCAVGCNLLNPPSSCSLDCLPGCFCRAPYILLDANDSQSTCVLPHHCQKSSTPPATCSDPRKEWSSCGAQNCARSCSNLLGFCDVGQCSSGCVCREPYVLQDYKDLNSRCVLPSECERKCVDPMKEFLTCGSSCPIGCDNRHPSSCTPCRAGCFCKNGLVLLNSTEWQTSICVRLADCPELSSSTTTTSEELTTTHTFKTVAETKKEINVSSVLSTTVFPQSSQCPATTLDVGGRNCNTDTDCPLEQRCCRSIIVSLGVNPTRCTCHDPLAIWTQCGSLCPEYCGQPAIPVCSSTCNPGCHCAPGYVRARNDITAPCIPREACSQVPALAMANLDGMHATIREILPPPADPFSPQMTAIAYVSGPRSDGVLTLSQIASSKLRISGHIRGLSKGVHAVVLHQRGDVSNDCSKIGPPLTTRNVYKAAYLGDLNASESEGSQFSRIVDWSLAELLGRSLAIHSSSTLELLHRSQEDHPLACATIALS